MLSAPGHNADVNAVCMCTLILSRDHVALRPLGHTLFHLVGCSGLHFPSICSRPLISSLKLLIQPFFLEFDLLFTVNLMRFGMMISACGIKDIQVFVSPVRFLARCLTASRSFLAAHCRRNSFCEHNNSSTLSL